MAPVEKSGQGAENAYFAYRVRFLGLVLLGALAVAAVRTFDLQVSEHKQMQKLSAQQVLSEIKLPARRGSIVDANDKPLAISVDVPSVFANPSEVADPRTTARVLSKLLDLDARATFEKLSSDRMFVWLKRQITPALADKVRALKIAGVQITQEPKRYYPQRELAGQLVGFTGVDGKGLEGVERTFDKVLAGEAQVAEAIRDGRGRSVLSGGLDPEARAHGADLKLTLDTRIQHVAEEELAKSLSKTRAKGAMAVVLDVESADVLALAVAPAFNPNAAQGSDAQGRRNRALTDVFEPGSTLKPLVVAAALDAQALKPDAIVNCEGGSMTIGKHTIRDSQPHGWLSLQGIVQKSSNIGAAKVGMALGRQRLFATYQGVGFGKRSALGIEGEVTGVLRPTSSWSDVALATQSYGHGLSVTALQLAAAYRVLAAGGVYLAPRLVHSVGAEEEGKARESRRVVSADAVKRVRAMMETVVSAEGTGLQAQVPGYRVAGKTGTAQKIDPLTGGYSNDHFVASFAGFLPAQNPKVVIAVMVDDPEGEHSGGAIAAPIFSRIAAAAMGFLDVPGDASVASIAPTPAASTIEEGTSVVTAQLTTAETGKNASGQEDYTGLLAREVLERYSVSAGRDELVLEGSGRVVRQEVLKNGDTKTLKLVLQ